jgi:hypothetical protein
METLFLEASVAQGFERQTLQKARAKKDKKTENRDINQ